MTFRGYFAINGVEIANSSRCVEHMGLAIPTTDVGLIIPNDVPPLPGPDTFPGSDLYPDSGPCALVPAAGHPGMFEMPASSTMISPGLWTVPDGARRYARGLIEVDGECWGPSSLCASSGCRTHIGYDDSWTGLQEFLQDSVYRVELAPWFSTRIPESGEFGGLWMLDVEGLGPAPVARAITEMVGSGAVAAPYRDASRAVTFDCLLIACTNAGLEYGLEWLTCLLRATNTVSDSVLEFFTAHPQHSGADPATLLRDAHGAVLVQAPQVTQQFNGGGAKHQQSTIYRVKWTMQILHPYLYLPSTTVPVEWDTIVTEPITWVHAANCDKPTSCEPMPILFSETCVPDVIDVVTSPPPSCGGCMPVCAVQTHVFQVPTFDQPLRCRETAVTLTVTNTGIIPVTFQGYWRVCGSEAACEDNRFPVQISGLPVDSSVTLDSISGRYYATVDNRARHTVGIVGTPKGAPWRPIIIDRGTCWEFIVTAPGDADFTISMTFADRDA